MVLDGGTLETKRNGNNAEPITIGGDYTQNGGDLRLRVYDAGLFDNDTLFATGQITLGSDSTLDLATPNGPISVGVGSIYLLMGSETGINGSFGTVEGLDDFDHAANIRPIILTLNNIDDVESVVALVFAQDMGTMGNLTPNQRSVGHYLDTHLPLQVGGNLANLAASVYLLGEGVGGSLDELSPQRLQILSSIAFNNAAFYNQALDNHLASLRDGLTGFDASQFMVSGAGVSSSMASIRGRLLAYSPMQTPGRISDLIDPIMAGVDTKDAKEMTDLKHDATPADRWSTFLAGNVILGELNHSIDVTNQNYTTTSVTAGADYRLDDHFTTGLMFGYGHTGADLDRIGSKVTVDSYSPGLYASYVDGGWYANGLVNYAYNDYRTDRSVDLLLVKGINKGSPDGSQYGTHFTGGYEFQKGAVKFGPLASVQYTHLSIDSFSESGPTSLDIASQSADSFRTQLGGEVRVRTRIGAINLTPHVSATWQHEYLDDSRGINSSLNELGTGSFTVNTDSGGRDSALISIGADTEISKSINGFVDYEAQAGSDNFFGQSVDAGLSIRF